MQNYEVNASGGSDKTQYYSSIGYYDQQGIILNSGFKRLSARMNLDYQQSEKLKITTNLNLTRAITNRVQEENSKEGATKNGVAAPPNVPVYNEDGSYAYDLSNTARENPVAMLKLPTNTAETFRILGNVAAEYQIIKGLSFKTTWGMDMSHSRANVLYASERYQVVCRAGRFRSQPQHERPAVDKREHPYVRPHL